jgi:hypothetical protein
MMTMRVGCPWSNNAAKRRRGANSRNAIDTKPRRNGSRETAHSERRSGCVMRSISRRSKMPGIERRNDGDSGSKRRMGLTVFPNRRRAVAAALPLAKR